MGRSKEMEAHDHDETTPQGRARQIVNFWRRRGWSKTASPIHVLPLDLDKLEELIADELIKREGLSGKAPALSRG